MYQNWSAVCLALGWSSGRSVHVAAEKRRKLAMTALPAGDRDHIVGVLLAPSPRLAGPWVGEA
jgi:hypothetical protein